jgi:hypothetical protein
MRIELELQLPALACLDGEPDLRGLDAYVFVDAREQAAVEENPRGCQAVHAVGVEGQNRGRWLAGRCVCCLKESVPELCVSCAL